MKKQWNNKEKVMRNQKSNRKIFIIGGVVAAIMFLFCFAMVPLYNVICKTTGINTSLRTELTKPTTAADLHPLLDKSRTVIIQFTTTNHNGMPWDFYQRTQSIVVHPGENITVYFHARNTTTNRMTVQAIPSMTPTDAISHFHKIECFCFRQQTLAGGESKEMPLMFNIDKNLPKDIHVITLAYTLFDVTTNKKA